MARRNRDEIGTSEEAATTAINFLQRNLNFNFVIQIHFASRFVLVPAHFLRIFLDLKFVWITLLAVRIPPLHKGHHRHLSHRKKNESA
jgi:hypothetical protein